MDWSIIKGCVWSRLIGSPEQEIERALDEKQAKLAGGTPKYDPQEGSMWRYCATIGNDAEIVYTRAIYDDEKGWAVRSRYVYGHLSIITTEPKLFGKDETEKAGVFLLDEHHRRAKWFCNGCSCSLFGSSS